MLIRPKFELGPSPCLTRSKAGELYMLSSRYLLDDRNLIDGFASCDIQLLQEFRAEDLHVEDLVFGEMIFVDTLVADVADVASPAQLRLLGFNAGDNNLLVGSAVIVVRFTAAEKY